MTEETPGEGHNVKAAYKAAQQELSDAILRLSPFQKNDIVRDKHTGFRYRVAGGSGHLIRGRPAMLLEGYRVYSSGRREAMSRSWIDSLDLEKVES